MRYVKKGLQDHALAERSVLLGLIGQTPGSHGDQTLLMS
jgi:hypothetical protein